MDLWKASRFEAVYTIFERMLFYKIDTMTDKTHFKGAPGDNFTTLLKGRTIQHAFALQIGSPTNNKDPCYIGDDQHLELCLEVY